LQLETNGKSGLESVILLGNWKVLAASMETRPDSATAVRQGYGLRNLGGSKRPFQCRLLKIWKRFKIRELKTHMRTMVSGFKIGILLLIATFAALLPGCATNQDTQQQNNNQTTLSGYIGTGANKSIR
jgi:hypothetical protein